MRPGLEHAALGLRVEPPISPDIDPSLLLQFPQAASHPPDQTNPAGLLRRPRIQRSLAGAVAAAPSLRALRRPMAGTTPGHAPLVALLDHIAANQAADPVAGNRVEDVLLLLRVRADVDPVHPDLENRRRRSEEHTSELQSRGHLVCRL